jgi:hypothetical protein
MRDDRLTDGELGDARAMNLDYVLAAVLFVFMVTVLLVLWRREHPRRKPTD